MIDGLYEMIGVCGRVWIDTLPILLEAGSTFWCSEKRWKVVEWQWYGESEWEDVNIKIICHELDNDIIMDVLIDGLKRDWAIRKIIDGPTTNT